jgi:hypothetical protein
MVLLRSASMGSTFFKNLRKWARSVAINAQAETAIFSRQERFDESSQCIRLIVVQHVASVCDHCALQMRYRL